MKHTIERILFATDFSRFSGEARDFLLTIAKPLKATVVLLHVVQPVDPLGEGLDQELSEWYENLQKQMSRKLEKEAEVFKEEGVVLEARLEEGKPWQLILETAEKEKADLIVVGSHGIDAHEGRLLLGTASHKIALASRIPVLIVHQPPEQ